jgi:copper transport protein
MRLVAGLVTLLSVLGFASGAFGHASLISTEPGDGSVLSQAPKTVRLRFNESVAPASIKLIDGTGRAREDVSVVAQDNVVEINLPDDLRGTLLVSYRVVSADGHPVGGSLVFSIGMPVSVIAPPSERTPALGILIWLARVGVYIGLFAGVGGTFFAVWIARAKFAPRVIVPALAIGLASSVAACGLQGIDLLALMPSDILMAAPWKAAAATSLLPSLLIAIAAMALAIVVALRDMTVRSARVLSASAILLVGTALAASGHASTAQPQWLTRPMVFFHGIGVAYWVGALAPLAAMTRRPIGSLLVVLNRFSLIAMPVVAALAVTGFVLAIVQLEGVRPLIETSYGLILLTKLVLVACLLCLAALNRFRLTPQLAIDCPHTKSLTRSIVLECVVALGILGVVAGWRFTPPPRVLASAAVKPLAVHIHTDAAMFQVLISPGTVGRDSFVLQLMDGDAAPLVAKETTLTLSMPERGIEPLQRPAKLGADGYWHVPDVPIPYQGRWHMRIEALITDFRKVTLEDDFDVASP